MGLYLGSNSANNISGSADNDSIYGYGGNDVLQGLEGRDELFGGTGDDTLIGGTGADSLIGGTGIDAISYGNSAAGVIIYLSSNGKSGGAFGGEASGDYFQDIENVIGSSGDDNLYGDGGNNALTGGLGDDYLSGGDGNDQLFGGAGADVFVGGAGADHHDGGQATDILLYHTSPEAISLDLALFTASGGFAEGDTMQGVEEIEGSTFNDTISGDAAENTFYGQNGHDTLTGRGADDGLFGGNGNDILEGGTGHDLLDGGEGIDTVSYRYASSAVSMSIEGLFVGLGESAGDQLISIERLMGSEFDDSLGGGAGANRLTGRDGDDLLQGWTGADVLIGGRGDDVLDGGGGADIFDYTALNQGGDTIEDFVPGTDRLRFASGAFGGLAEGELDASRFEVNPAGTATNGTQRFIYESDTGILRFDANGNNAGGVTVIVTLEGDPALVASDIVIA